MSTKLVVEAVLKNAVSGETTNMKDQMPTRGKSLNYGVIDAYANLVSLLIRHMIGGGSTDQIATQRVSLLNKVIGITVRTRMSDYERCKQEAAGGAPLWDQRPISGHSD